MEETTPFAQAPISGSKRACLQGVYLQRLQRLLRLRHQHEQHLNRHGLRLLDRSIFAAYCDCRHVGAEEEGRELLREAKFALEQPTEQLDMAGARPGPRPEG